MNAHPGGEDHTRRMLELAGLRPGAGILDLGAGAGETVALLQRLGYAARGLDLAPRSPLVEQGDLLHSGYPDGCFDAIISQCAFFVSGDVPGALRESCRLLRSGGLLLYSDVFFTPPETLLAEAGFRLLAAEDMTPQWKEYYIDALWRGDTICCDLPRGKCSYWLLIGKKA